MISARGRGAVRIALGDLEYWIAAPTPRTTSPRRHPRSRDRRGPLGGAAAALHPRLARTPAERPQRERAAHHGRDPAPDTSPAPPPRRPALGIGSLACSALLVLAPVVLLAGAGNPPCTATPRTTPRPARPPAGMFAAPLQLQPGRWYQVGATQYGGPSDPSSGVFGSSGAYLPAHPDSFAELSLLDSNPANGGGRSRSPTPTRSATCPRDRAARRERRPAERCWSSATSATARAPARRSRTGSTSGGKPPRSSASPRTRPDPARCPASGSGGAARTSSPTGTQPTTATAAALPGCAGHDPGPLPITPGPVAQINPRHRDRVRTRRRPRRGQARDRRRQPADRQALHLGRRARRPRPARRRL